jgi:hypothetical protein
MAVDEAASILRSRGVATQAGARPGLLRERRAALCLDLRASRTGQDGESREG